MAVLIDPEGKSNTTFHELVNVTGKRVLEVGCGDGRLTWGYAKKALHVTGIDPDGDGIAAAQANIPKNLRHRVVFFKSNIEDLMPSGDDVGFDIIYFSWSL